MLGKMALCASLLSVGEYKRRSMCMERVKYPKPISENIPNYLHYKAALNNNTRDLKHEAFAKFKNKLIVVNTEAKLHFFLGMIFNPYAINEKGSNSISLTAV